MRLFNSTLERVMNTKFLIKSTKTEGLILHTNPNKNVESKVLSIDKNKFSTFDKIAKFIRYRVKIDSRTKTKWNVEVT